MEVITTKLPGVLIIKPDVFGDSRGFFLETYQQQKYADLGIDQKFVQDNQSRSQRGVLRGLHFQKTKPQGKLVMVTRGNVFDVAVDINPQSATYGQYVAAELSDKTLIQFYIPPGYAHGFVVLSDDTDFCYKCTDFYDPADEGGVIWNDPDINIDWPIKQPALSDKDKQLPTLKQLHEPGLEQEL